MREEMPPMPFGHPGREMARYMLENGGDPRRWIDQFKRSKRIDDSDRMMWELRPIIDVFYYGGIVDQINMASLASFDVLSRSPSGSSTLTQAKAATQIGALPVTSVVASASMTP